MLAFRHKATPPYLLDDPRALDNGGYELEAAVPLLVIAFDEFAPHTAKRRIALQHRVVASAEVHHSIQVRRPRDHEVDDKREGALQGGCLLLATAITLKRARTTHMHQHVPPFFVNMCTYTCTPT